LDIEGLSLSLEAVQVTSITEDYNSGSVLGGSYNTAKATVADPPVTNFTKAFLSYKIKDTTFILGEKALNLDTQRFIGSVGWRQMPQTFGMFSITQKVDKDISLMGALLYRRNGITPENDKKYRRGSGILRADYTYAKNTRVTGYAYLLEDLHSTYGANVFGKVDIEDVKITYRAEYALQRDPVVGNTSAIDIQSDYYNVEVGGKAGSMFSKLGYEVLGDKKSGTNGFSAPYATGHKFNGWADVLLGRAGGGHNDGLKDLYVTVGYGSKSFGKTMVVYHKFDSSVNGVDLGSEIDLLYKKKLNENVALVAKAAIYSKGGSTTTSDTKKYWLMTTVGL
jgi:hypothetical protein